MQMQMEMEMEMQMQMEAPELPGVAAPLPASDPATLRSAAADGWSAA